MKKKKHQLSKNLTYPLIAIVVFSVIAMIYILAQLNTRQNNFYNTPYYSPPQPQTKIFKSSKIMKFSIVVPYTYEVVENLGSVTINTNTGKILIGRNGTNFGNLKDYIKNSHNNLETRVLDKRELMINGLESISGKIGIEKTYFIYAESFVYILSTSSSALFDDLDKISQSFRYAP